MTYESLMREVRANLAGTISKLGMPSVDFAVVISRPQFGDLSSNAPFLLAKRLGTSPFEIAGRLSDGYACGGLVSETQAHKSGYLNFFVNRPAMNKAVIADSMRGNYGCVSLGGQAITIEHTSVNPNKALHIGHVRNIVIGDTVARILRKAGFCVSVLNYVDDSGLQVADIVLGFMELGFEQDPPGKFDQYCGDTVYVQTTKKYEQDPGLKERRQEILRELEDGTSDTARFADRMTKRVLDGQLETCWSLSVTYDCLNFESHIIRSGMWGDVFAKLKKMKLIELESDGRNSGCWVIRGRDGQDDKVLVRSDGTATYMAKDIPYAAWKLGLIDDPFGYAKYKREQPGRTLWQTVLPYDGKPRRDFSGRRVITVIDSRQLRLQQMIKSLIDEFQSDNAYVHLSYESVTLSGETAGELGAKPAQMSGRKGLYVNADTVLELLRKRAQDETRKKNPLLDDASVRGIAGDIAVATIRYEMIRQDLDKPIAFDAAKSLSLEGDTASYIQYGYARAVRVLERHGSAPDFDADYGLLDGDYERELVKMIGTFAICVTDAANNISPKVVARYCHGLAVAFNGFYEHVRILDSDAARINARLCLVSSFASTLEKAMDLLGIPATKKM